MIEKDRDILDKPEDNKNSDDNWKWGIIYYAPHDKRIFVPSRLCMGWTINFGNPAAVIIFILIIAASIALKVYTNAKGY